MPILLVFCFLGQGAFNPQNSLRGCVGGSEEVWWWWEVRG